MKKSIAMSEEAQISRFLGIDYGRSKIGLAMADSETRIAFAYGVRDNDRRLFDDLADLIRRENVSLVIVGIPSYINREETEYESEDFGHTLESHIAGIKVEYYNEMFSTKMAHDNLREKGMKNIKSLDHQEAAKIILQGWLDKK